MHTQPIALNTPVIVDGWPATVIGRTYEEHPRYELVTPERVFVSDVPGHELRPARDA